MKSIKVRKVIRLARSLPGIAILSVLIVVGAAAAQHILRPRNLPGADENDVAYPQRVSGAEAGRSGKIDPNATSTQKSPAAKSGSATGAGQQVPAAQAAPAAPAASAPTTQTGFGMADGSLPWRGAAAIEAELKDMSALGMTWVRVDFHWRTIQPDNASKFNWTTYDAFANAAKSHGIKVLGTLAYSPSWARPSGCNEETCGPADANTFASFAGKVAERYKSYGIHDWEIWNEPNLKTFWKPAPNAAAYTAMLRASYKAIKAVDPSAVVVSGGLGSSDELSGTIEQLGFLQDMYGSGAAGTFDALGYHSYAYPATPLDVESWSGWSKMNDLRVSLRSIMITNGEMNKQIWQTEFGAPTGGPGYQATEAGYDPAAGDYYVSEGLQARMAEQAVAVTKTQSWAGPLFWYSYKDRSTDMSTSENFYGLLRADGSRKPVFDALGAAIKR